MDSKVELLKRIKALADNGVDGEKINAENTLARLMEKYNVDEKQLEDETQKTCYFSYKQETDRRLLMQIIYAVTGEAPSGTIGAFSRRKRKMLAVDCTNAEQIEIEINYEFYKAAFNEDLEIFISAFVSKNHIYPSPDKVKEDYFTDRERDLERELKTAAMAKGIDKRTPLKLITAGGTL